MAEVLARNSLKGTLIGVWAGEVCILYKFVCFVHFTAKDFKPISLLAKVPSLYVVNADVPTVAESGYPGFEMTQWYGLNAPANMPQIAIDKIAAATAIAMKNPQATERLRGDTALPVGDSPAQYAAFIAAEQARWKVVAARAKIKPD